MVCRSCSSPHTNLFITCVCCPALSPHITCSRQFVQFTTVYVFFIYLLLIQIAGGECAAGPGGSADHRHRHRLPRPGEYVFVVVVLYIYCVCVRVRVCVCVCVCVCDVWCVCICCYYPIHSPYRLVVHGYNAVLCCKNDLLFVLLYVNLDTHNQCTLISYTLSSHNTHNTHYTHYSHYTLHTIHTLHLGVCRGVGEHPPQPVLFHRPYLRGTCSVYSTYNCWLVLVILFVFVCYFSDDCMLLRCGLCKSTL